MIKFKKVIVMTLATALLLSITACKNKEPIPASAYKEKVQEMGYQVVDITEQYSQPFILQVYGNELDGLHMEFFQTDTLDNSVGIFNTNKQIIETYKGSSSVESSVSLGHYKKYTLKTSDKYYVIVQLEKTFIYSYANKTDSAKLDDIIKVLGY